MCAEDYKQGMGAYYRWPYIWKQYHNLFCANCLSSLTFRTIFPNFLFLPLQILSKLYLIMQLKLDWFQQSGFPSHDTILQLLLLRHDFFSITLNVLHQMINILHFQDLCYLHLMISHSSITEEEDSTLLLFKICCRLERTLQSWRNASICDALVISICYFF